MGWTWKDLASELRGPMRTSLRSSPLLLALAASTAIGLAAAGQLTALTRGESHPISFVRALEIDLPVWWYWGLATPLVLLLGRRAPLRTGRGIATHVAALAGLAVLHAFAMAVLTGPLFPSDGPPVPFAATFVETLLNRAISDAIVYAAILGIGSAVDTARLQAELAGAELRALKMQLHPHFLFNTLNTAAVLTEENPAAAKDVLGLLADLLRATLDQSGVQEIRLSEELELLETYLTIERTRFPDRLSVDFAIDADVTDVWVPNLVLQPLVENAVRYAIAPRAAPGRITVSARHVGDALVLAVTDDGPGIARGGNGAGLGISNTRARLERLYGSAGRLELAPAPGGRGTLVTVTLPFRTQSPSR